jgi:hypothetical protein
MEATRSLWTTKDRAEIEHRSVRSIERERERGDGCPYVQLGRLIFYRPEDVEKYHTANLRGAERFRAALQVEQAQEPEGDASASSKPSQQLKPSDTPPLGRGRPRESEKRAK